MKEAFASIKLYICIAQSMKELHTWHMCEINVKTHGEVIKIIKIWYAVSYKCGLTSGFMNLCVQSACTVLFTSIMLHLSDCYHTTMPGIGRIECPQTCLKPPHSLYAYLKSGACSTVVVDGSHLYYLFFVNSSVKFDCKFSCIVPWFSCRCQL